MSRTVSSREFFHNFAKLNKELKSGETLVITKHGKPLGEFRKPAKRRKFQMPDFKKLGLEPKASMTAREKVYRRLIGKIEGESVS
jgi:antitoxin (DNA-binding transcriptional repressor) of toxin-antitoxin stability system